MTTKSIIIESLIKMVKESIVEGYEEYYEEDQAGATQILEDNSDVIQSLQKLSSMDEIKAITIEGYEDAGYDGNDLYARDDVVTYDMKTKRQDAVFYGFGNIECEGSGGELAFKYTSNPQKALEDYLEE